MSRSRQRRWRRRLFAALVAACLVVPLAPVPVAAARGVSVRPPAAGLAFTPPVDAEISDGWRPPDHPYGPGNRGWQYATASGDVVSAAGDGVVAFAGPVGGSGAVTVAHVGGLRTTYSYLETVDVIEGQRVKRGQRAGAAGEAFHFGVLLAGDYVDPAVLFRPGALRLAARLLPA